MSLNKKLLAGAIVGLLFSTAASAATLGTAPVNYAAEMNVPVTLTPVPAAADIDFLLGYNFTSTEFRTARFECTSNAQITSIGGITLSSGNVTFGAINGTGTSAITFSMTAGATSPLPATAGDTVSIDVTGLKLVGAGDVNCAFSLYDQPSQASNGGTTGLIYTTGMKAYIKRVPSFVFTAAPGVATADVEAANGAYTDFVFGNGVFGELTFTPVAVMPLKANGTQITMNDIFSGDTAITVDGDFSAADDVEWNGVAEDAIDDTVASWDYATAVGLDGPLDFLENGDDAIPASDYSATLHADTNAGYTVANKTVDAGKIVRNGTELQAPFVQLPGGWISRVVLTNTGKVAREYTISTMSESGVTLTTDASKLTGTIAANSTKVIELTQVITASSATNIRGTVEVNVSAPNNTIQGLYQIVNGQTGSISNHVMVRPGTN